VAPDPCGLGSRQMQNDRVSTVKEVKVSVLLYNSLVISDRVTDTLILAILPKIF